MEIGYINSRKQFPPGQFGPWKHCVESDVRRIVGDNDTPLKLSAMADAEKSDYKEDILPKSESVIDLIRVATYIHQIPLALDMIKDAHDKGYETSLNLMALSTVPRAGAERGAGPGGPVRGRRHLHRRQLRRALLRADRRLHDHLPGLRRAGRQGSGHARPQQPAARVRQHRAGDDQGRQPAGRQHGGSRARGGQLRDGAVAELPAQPQVPAAAGAALHPAPHRADARGSQVGLRLPLHDDRGAEPASAGGGWRSTSPTTAATSSSSTIPWKTRTDGPGGP